MVSHINIISDVFAQKKHLYDFTFIKKEKKLVFGDYYDTAFSIFFDIFFPAIYIHGAISPGISENEILLPIEHIKKNNVNILVAVPSTIQRIKLYYGNNKINHPFKTGGLVLLRLRIIYLRSTLCIMMISLAGPKII